MYVYSYAGERLFADLQPQHLFCWRRRPQGNPNPNPNPNPEREPNPNPEHDPDPNPEPDPDPNPTGEVHPHGRGVSAVRRAQRPLGGETQILSPCHGGG